MSSSSSRPRTTPRLRGSEPCTQTPEGGRAPLALGSRAIVICRKPEVAGSAQVREQLASLSTLSNLCVFFERRQERHSCFLLNAFMSMEMRGLSKFNYGTGCRHVSIRGNESSKKDLREKLIQMRKSCSSGAGGLGCESGGSMWGRSGPGPGPWLRSPLGSLGRSSPQAGREPGVRVFTQTTRADPRPGSRTHAWHSGLLQARAGGAGHKWMLMALGRVAIIRELQGLWSVCFPRKMLGPVITALGRGACSFRTCCPPPS